MGRAHGALAVLVAGVLLAGTFGWALAHAQLIATEPRENAVLERPPERVRLQFNEPIEPEFFALEVYAADRTRVDRRDAQLVPGDPSALQTGLGALSTGTYTVVWRALSIDGHVVRGVFAFTVGAGATPGAALRFDPGTNTTDNLAAVVRWLTFFATFLLVGGLLFYPLVLWPAHRAVGTAAGLVAIERGGRVVIWLVWIGVVALFVLSLAALVVQAASVTGVALGEVFDGRAITRLLTGTKYGALWLARMGLVLGLLVVAVLLAIEARPSRGLRRVGAALGAGLLLTLAMGGHASAVIPGTALAVAVDWLHLLAGATWVGGLAQLLLALPVALGGLDQSGKRVVLARVVRRFSVIAGLSVALMVLTGLYTSLLHVPAWIALLDTAYGAALSGKLILIAPLLAIAAANLLVMHPRFVRAARRGNGDDLTGRSVFRALVAAELAFITGVLGVTGILTGLPPASSEALEAIPYTETTQVGDLTVGLEVRPNQAGTNQIIVFVPNSTGRPATDVQRVDVAMSHLEMTMSTRETPLQPRGDGRYELSGNQLSMSGRWQVDVRIRRTAGDVSASFTPVVSPPPGVNRPAISPARVLLLAVTDPGRDRSLAVNPRFLTVLVFAAATVLLILRSTTGRRHRTAATAAAAFTLAVTAFLGGTTIGDAYRRSLPNPVPADAASLARGQTVYLLDCAICHGDEGRGDGPAGFGLRPRPADFRVHMAAGHTDVELFTWVTGGVDGTAMRGFGTELTEQERWDVINYIRSFANQR